MSQGQLYFLVKALEQLAAPSRTGEYVDDERTEHHIETKTTANRVFAYNCSKVITPVPTKSTGK
jgi:hypothetical protein